MRRITMLLAALLAVIALGGEGSGLAEQATPVAKTFPGEIAVTTVVYTAAGLHLFGTQAFEFGVAEFTDAATARAALAPMLTAIEARLPNATLHPTSVPAVGDAAQAVSGTTPTTDGSAIVTILVFCAGRYLHAWIAGALASDPMIDFQTIITHMQADHRLPSTSLTLQAHLPQLSDLPPGFSLDTINGTPTAPAP